MEQFIKQIEEMVKSDKPIILNIRGNERQGMSTLHNKLQSFNDK